MSNIALITSFYESFAQANAEGMIACYHDDIVFSDPAFGELRGNDAKNMWRMLVERSKGQIKISFHNVKADSLSGSADWRAEYIFAQTGNKVINNVSAKFEFKEGKVLKHTDYFDMWKWSRQALGLKGYLLGWSSFLQGRVQKQTNDLLNAYNKKNDLSSNIQAP